MMVAAAVLAAVLAATSGWLLQPLRARAVRRLFVPSASRGSGGGIPVAVAIAGVSVWAVVGGVLGLVAAVGVAWWVSQWLRSKPAAELLARQRQRGAGLPVAVDLLAACLSSGASTSRTLQVVCRCVEPSVQHDLGRVAAAMEVGAAPDEAWSLVRDGDLEPVAAIMRRSAVTGAPAAAQLGTLAVELRARLRAHALADARALGVRTAGPLGVCFLPAFILIGVVPLVASLVQQWF